MAQSNNWVNHPSKKQLILIILVAFVGIFLMLLSMTNFLTETPFQGKYVLMYLVIFGACLTVFKVCRNYFKNKI